MMNNVVVDMPIVQDAAPPLLFCFPVLSHFASRAKLGIFSNNYYIIVQMANKAITRNNMVTMSL